MVVGVWLFNAPARLSLFPARPVDSRCALPCTSATRQPVGVALEIFGPYELRSWAKDGQDEPLANQT